MPSEALRLQESWIRVRTAGVPTPLTTPARKSSQARIVERSL